jgi:hypothetical protein
MYLLLDISQETRTRNWDCLYALDFPPTHRYVPVLFLPATRGVSRPSRTLGKDAVDAGIVVGRTAALRTAKSCGPGAPGLALSLGVDDP